MTHEPEDPEVRAAEVIDPGEPVAALAAFEHETSSELIVRIRRTIQRRTTVGQLAAFVANTPLVVLKEFWFLLNQPLGPIRSQGSSSHGEKTY